MLTIEEVMIVEQRTQQPLHRELEWEARLNYENSMMNYLCQLDRSQRLNLTDVRRHLANILILHEECAGQAVQHLAKQQVDEFGYEMPQRLLDFEEHLQTHLLRLLQRHAPQIVSSLRSQGDQLALATAFTVGAMTGETSPIVKQTKSSNQQQKNNLNSKLHKSNAIDVKSPSSVACHQSKSVTTTTAAAAAASNVLLCPTGNSIL